MEYKEKLRLAKEALDSGFYDKETIEYIFPELKESGDERTWIINYLSNRILNSTIIAEKENLKKAIAWVEKQGENINLPKFTFDDVLALQCAMEAAKKVQKDKDLYEQLKSLHDRLHDAYWLKKQGEQNPAKNIVKTWKEMRLEVYQQASGNRHEPNYSDDTTKMFSLNDIDEIIEKMSEQKSADKVEPKFKVGDVVTNKKSKDTVKIVQILHDSYCYSGWDGAATVHSDFSISEQDGWELVEQKPAWSEEDSSYFDDICELLINILHSENHNYNKEAIKKDLSWLISLKDRVGCEVNCTTTKGWSKDDEEIILKMMFAFTTRVFPSSKECGSFIDFLKSLKHTWKPSDEQIKALDEVYKTHGANNVCRRVLFNLMNDLKKLREE